MTYPLPTNWATANTFTPTNMNNVAALVNAMWLLLAAVPAMPTARVATVGTETFTIAAGSVTTIAGSTIDGVTVSATGAANGFGDYVLVPNAPATTGVGAGAGVLSTQPANGLYQVTAVATNITLARATSMSASGAASTPAGMSVLVMAGTVNTGLGFEVTSPASSAAFTYGTTPINFSLSSITPTGIQTLTNKRITKRVGNTASSATPAINTDNVDVYKITALATNITGWTITGTPGDCDELAIVITDNGTPRNIAWAGSPFESSGVASLPNVTPKGNTMRLKFVYDAVDSSWVLMAVDVVGY